MRRRASRHRRVLLWIVAILAGLYAALVGVRVLYPIDHVSMLTRWSHAHGVDPALTAAVIRCESRYRSAAVSPVGAIGLMQIMPETGAWIAEQLAVPDFAAELLYDPEINVRFGTWYLARQLARFGTVEDALRAYNAGPANAERWMADSTGVFPATAAYVARVQRNLPIYRVYLSARWLLNATPSLLF